METRSGRKLSVKVHDCEGESNTIVHAMATPNSPDTLTSTATVSSADSVGDQSVNTHFVYPPMHGGNNTSREHGHGGDFQAMVLASLNTIISGQEELKRDLENFKSDICKTVEFQGEEIADLQKLTKEQNSRLDTLDAQGKLLEIKTKNQYSTLKTYRDYVSDLWGGINKLERQSRRSNILIIGIKEMPGENVEEIVTHILQNKFSREDIEIERAHRDGKKRHPRGNETPRPRHILVKLLRYKDKVEIMKMSRQTLRNELYHIVEDLTAADLEEKKRHSDTVSALYKQGVKLRFIAGVWRDRNGKPADFYKNDDSPKVESSPPECLKVSLPPENA